MSIIQYGQNIYKEIGNYISSKRITTFNDWQLTQFTLKKKKKKYQKKYFMTYLNGLVYLKVQKSILKIHKINHF